MVRSLIFICIHKSARFVNSPKEKITFLIVRNNVFKKLETTLLLLATYTNKTFDNHAQHFFPFTLGNKCIIIYCLSGYFAPNKVVNNLKYIIMHHYLLPFC